MPWVTNEDTGVDDWVPEDVYVDPESKNVGDPGVKPVVTPDPRTIDNETDRTTTAPQDWWTKIPKEIRDLFGTKPDGTPNFSGSQLGIAALMAYLGSKYDTAKPSGGGVTKAYAGYTPIQRTMGVGPMAQPGIPGQPIARYGGIASIVPPPPPPPVIPPPLPTRQQPTDKEVIDTPRESIAEEAPGPGIGDYARGGVVALEDGGFIMTKRAVDGAGGPRGIQSLVPGAKPLRGPGTGTSDSIPAKVVGRGGATPAAVSNGEAYIPPRHVQQAGGSQALYSLMNRLQKGR